MAFFIFLVSDLIEVLLNIFFLIRIIYYINSRDLESFLSRFFLLCVILNFALATANPK